MVHSGGRSRSRHDWLATAGVFVLVFVLAGLTASGVEYLRVQRDATWLASAAFTLPKEWFAIAHRQSGGLAPLEPDSVAEEILAVADREAVRRTLRVTLGRPTQGVLRIGLSISCPDQQRAVRQVNELAGDYAANLGLGLSREILRRAAEIRAQQQRFDRELDQLRPQFQRIVDRAVSKAAAYGPAAEEPAAEASPRGPNGGVGRIANPSYKRPVVFGPLSDVANAGTELRIGSPPEGEPAMGPHEIEIYERAKLQEALGELRQRRERLLIDRTPLHPEVLQLDTQIQEMERQLAAMPALLARPTRGATGKVPRPVPEPIPAPKAIRPAPSVSPSPQSTELFRQIQQLQARLDGIVRDLKQMPQLEIPGAESLEKGDGLKIQWAERADRIGPGIDWPALALAALAAGLVAMAGVGMIWTGIGIDQPLSAAGIEADLAIPVVGSIVVDRPLPESRDNLAIRARWRWPSILGGLVILAAYCVFLGQPFLGR